MRTNRRSFGSSESLAQATTIVAVVAICERHWSLRIVAALIVYFFHSAVWLEGGPFGRPGRAAMAEEAVSDGNSGTDLEHMLAGAMRDDMPEPERKPPTIMDMLRGSAAAPSLVGPLVAPSPIALESSGEEPGEMQPSLAQESSSASRGSKGPSGKAKSKAKNKGKSKPASKAKAKAKSKGGARPKAMCSARIKKALDMQRRSPTPTRPPSPTRQPSAGDAAERRSPSADVPRRRGKVSRSGKKGVARVGRKVKKISKRRKAVAASPATTVAVRVENPEAWASAPAAPSLDTIAPRCSRCGLPLTRDKVQLTGKTRGVFRCGVCNVRGVQLHRLPGWKAFQETMRRLSPEQRMAFWRGSHSEDGPGLREYLADQEEVFSVSTEKQATTAHAEWLPLKVWKRRGYPAKRIKRLCERKKDPTLGWVYRVSLDSEDLTTSHERGLRETLSKSSSAGPSAAASASSSAAATGLLALTAGDDASPAKPSERDFRRSASNGAKVLARLSSVLVPLQADIGALVSPLCGAFRT